MAVGVYLSDELGQWLQKAAQQYNVSLDEFVELTLIGIIMGIPPYWDYLPSNEEMEIINASVRELINRARYGMMTTSLTKN